MKAKLKPSSYFLIAIIAIMIFVVIYSFTLQTVKLRTLPLIVSSFILLMSIIELRNEIARNSKSIEAKKGMEHEGTGKEVTNVKGFFIAFGWLVGLFAGISLIGFLPGIALFMISFLKVNRVSWLVSIISTAIMTGVFYTLFIMILEIRLYPGLLFGGAPII